MAVVILRKKPTKEQLAQMTEEFKDYVKMVIDLGRGIMAAGGQLHADGESLLLKDGSHQENLWGGGIDLVAKKIDCTAVINIRPTQENNSLEILDSLKRKSFFKITKRFFEGYEE
jgi:hypothetical protein